MEEKQEIELNKLSTQENLKQMNSENITENLEMALNQPKIEIDLSSSVKIEDETTIETNSNNKKEYKLEMNADNERGKLMLSYDTEENREILKNKIAEYFNTGFINSFEQKNSEFYKDVEEIKLSFYFIAVEAECLKSQLLPHRPSTAALKHNKIDLQGDKKPSANESFFSYKNSAQKNKEKKFEKLKPNPLTKSVDIDRESLRANKLNFNTERHNKGDSYKILSESQKEISTPKKNSRPKYHLNITNSKSIKEKDNEKEEEKEKSICEKPTLADRMKTTGKIKRPIMSIKSNTNSNPKPNNTNYETNITSNSNVKSPFASNFAADNPNLKKEKKAILSKDDLNIKHKKPLLENNNIEASKTNKTNKVEKKTNSDKNVNEEGYVNNLVENLSTKKSTNKILPVNKKANERINGNTKTEEAHEAKNKKTSDKSADKAKHEPLKDKKENKSSAKLNKINNEKHKISDSKNTKNEKKNDIKEMKKDVDSALDSNDTENRKRDTTPISNISNHIEIDNSEQITHNQQIMSSENIIYQKNDEPAGDNKNDSISPISLDDKYENLINGKSETINDEKNNNSQKKSEFYNENSLDIQIENKEKAINNKKKYKNSTNPRLSAFTIKNLNKSSADNLHKVDLPLKKFISCDN